jgi:AAA domain-containing protein/bifunctional DNA primase/polymerase-like protein
MPLEPDRAAQAAMTGISDITALRLQLRRAGFHPIPLEGKIPPLKGWQQKFDVSEEEIRRWEKTYPLARNTGVLAKPTPGLDIDIKIEAAAKAAEDKAREFLEERGDIYVRFGLPPKRLVPLRTDEPFKKLYRKFRAPDGSEHKLEMLGDGQQYVVDGIHPDTGKPYAWFGGELTAIKRESLPYTRHEDAEQLFDAMAKVEIEEHGFMLTGTSRGGKAAPAAKRLEPASAFAHPDPDKGYLGEGVIPSGVDLHNQWRKLNDVAIQRYSAWVPDIFPTARPSNGGYRVSSADLGRNLEEDLSFHEQGIKDFGVHDMGDPRGGSRSPIDIVEEWLHKDFTEAVRWLTEKLGLDPNDYLPKQEPQILPLRWHGEKDPLDDRTWAVENLIPEVGTGIISGQWGTLKTFVALELAHCIMTPRSFIGFDIARPGGVLMLALEGQSEVAIRFQAVLEKKGGKYLDGAPFVWTEVSPPLTDPKTADVIIATAKAVASRLKERFDLPLTLILIDSLIAGAGYRKEGQDNDAALTNTIMANMAKVSRAIGCFTFVIDHFGKDTNVGTRGSSVKEGDADVIFACLGDRSEAGQVTNSRLALRKRRSGPNGEEFPFHGVVVEMGLNPKTGKMETTLVVNWEETGQARTPKKDDWGRSKGVKILRRTIMNLLVDCGEQIKPWSDGPAVRALKVKLVESEFHKAYLTTGDTEEAKKHAKRMAFQRAINSTGDKVVTREVGGIDYIWLSQAGPGETGGHPIARPAKEAP